MINLSMFFKDKWKIWGTVCIFYITSVGEINAKKQGIFDIFYEKEKITITLETDINVMMENRRDINEHVGKLTYEDNDEEVIWDVKVSIRGRYRRMFSKGVPPLKIDFKKSQLKDRGLKAYDDLKLVTLFAEDKRAAYQILLKEFLVYKMYNLISPYSYRVKLLEVVYKDSYSGDSFKEWAFVIEDTDQLEDRMKIKEIKEKIDLEEIPLDTTVNNVAAMFQYFIGNGDWKFYQPKNIKLFEKEGKIMMVPYDFDFSGMVGAPYSVPNNLYGRRTVKDRVYLGEVSDLNNLSEAIMLFFKVKDALLELVDQTKPLGRSQKKEIKEFIESFYDDIQYRKQNNLDMKGILFQLMAEKDSKK